MSSTKKKRDGGRRKSGRNDALEGRSQQYTAKQLYEAAEHAMTAEDAHKAITLYDAALNVPMDRADMDAAILLEKRAEAKVSISDPDGARNDFQRALELFREQQPSTQNTAENSSDPIVLERMAALLMYMGQLSGGMEAIQSYREGIALLERSLSIREQQQSQQTSGTDSLSVTRKQLAAACCSAAELYLTDLCYEDNAEEECETLVQRALGINGSPDQPKSLDALQTAASLRLSQCRGMEAVVYIQQCFAQIQPSCEALCRLVGIRSSKEQRPQQKGVGNNPLPPHAMELSEQELEQQETMPGFEFRCQTAKLLLECSAVVKGQDSPSSPSDHPAETSVAASISARDCAEAAVTVLGSLLAENDTVIELWYLMGDAFASMGDDEADMARYYYENTMRMLQHVQQELQQQQEEQPNIVAGSEDDDEEQEEMLLTQLDEIECQLEDVQQKLSQLPSSSSTPKVATARDIEPMEEDS